MFAVILAALLFLTMMYSCGRYTAKYAVQRGRSKAVWFLLGALFYPVLYIVLALLRPVAKDGGGLTPPAVKRDPASELPNSRTGTLPGSRNDTTGYPRGGLTAVAVFE